MIGCCKYNSRLTVSCAFDYGRSEGKGKMGKFKIKVSNGQVAQVPEPFE